MSTSRISHTARSQARATGNSYQAVHSQLTTLSPDIDLLPIVASPAQQQLESLFLNWLNIFHYVPRESDYSGGERIRIDRVRSGPDHLVLSLDPITTLWHISAQVMPVSHSDDVDGVYDLSGVPGLRVKDDSLGVCLYRPGIQARIILAGISSHEWESSHHDGFALPHNAVGCLSTMFPNDWTESEREAERFHGIERDEIASIESTLLRRILLLTRLKPTGVNTWRTPLRGG